MDSSSFASIPFFGHEVRLLTYIRPVVAASVLRCSAMMGYSRAGSQSVVRASRIWSFAGSTGAGSTCLPSFGLLCNRELRGSSYSCSNKASRHQCAIYSGRYSPPRLSIAQAIRAVLLANAAATTLGWRRSSKALTHRLNRSLLALAVRIADRAPCISTILK